MHANEVRPGIEAVRRLIDGQFPHWRDLPLREVASSGTVNSIFLIGDEMSARFPLQGENPAKVHAWLQAEADAARAFARASPVPTPVPVAIGAPGLGYPLPWAVQTWLPGRDAIIDDPAASAEFAYDLVDLIERLRATDVRGRRFSGRGRGGNLTDHDEWLGTCFRESEHLLDTPELRRLWDELRVLPPVGPDVMSHGDLMPGNVLVRDGRLVGVLDTGGFAPADRALDLVSVWHLLDKTGRKEVRRGLGCGDVEWRRGMAWALAQAMGLVWYYRESNPVMSGLGRRTIGRIMSGV